MEAHMTMKLSIAVLVVGAPLAAASRLLRRAAELEKASDGSLVDGASAQSRLGRGALTRDALADGSEAGLEEILGTMVTQMLTSRTYSPGIKEIAKIGSKHMHFKQALPKLEGKLPSDILALARLTTNSSRSAGMFSEASLSKARQYMNSMMYDSWLQLDTVMLECKEFDESNRDTFSQVVTDLDHMGSDLADRERMKVEAEGGIADMSLRITDALHRRNLVKRNYETMRQQQVYELRLRKDDQDVFTAVLNITTCPNEAPDNSYSLTQWEVCQSASGNLSLRTDNPDVMDRIRRSPRVEKALLDVLRGESEDELSLLQVSSSELLRATARGGQAPPPQPVQEGPQEGQWKKCNRPENVNCGLLHDTMALQWGKFKDLVDEMTTMMEKNNDEFARERDNLNQQITSLRSSKTKHQEMLGEATSEINSLTAETREKEEQYRDLEKAYRIKMRDCHEKITEILYTNICAVRVVRNQIMDYSEETPSSSITDCDFTDWRPEICSVDCDDGCPENVGGIDVTICGGRQDLTRETIVFPNAVGMTCPPMRSMKKCNQKKCPKPCIMSEWSGFSGCSKQCGGGTQGKTRSVIQKPRDGGAECDTTLDERSCNTGSCDRDCTLFDWTPWSPCSMACGGGMQERVRNVNVPIRADGKCPKKSHPDRLEKQMCNTQECVGDEICIARQDLVIAVDGSGSLKQDGFDTLRFFAVNLTSRYQAVYYGVEEMRIGVVLFGNGAYLPQGYVQEAIMAHEISSDLPSVVETIKGLQWQRGFTNMMQALKKADFMFENGGRTEAQSAVLVLSDGKYTNAFRTGQQVQAMKDKNVQIYMAPISSTRGGTMMQTIRTWASEPVETNYERIPGLIALKNNEPTFAQLLLVKFCPRAFSPSRQMEEDSQIGYLKIREEAYPSDSCGAWTDFGPKETLEECFQAAKDAKLLAFAFEDGGRRAGTCYGEAIDVTEEIWDDALNNRTAQACPGGEWEFSYYTSTYILNPSRYATLIPTEEE